MRNDGWPEIFAGMGMGLMFTSILFASLPLWLVGCSAMLFAVLWDEF